MSPVIGAIDPYGLCKVMTPLANGASLTYRAGADTLTVVHPRPTGPGLCMSPRRPPYTFSESAGMHRIQCTLRLALFWACAAFPLAAGGADGQVLPMAPAATSDPGVSIATVLRPQPPALLHAGTDTGTPALIAPQQAVQRGGSRRTTGAAALAASFVAATLLDQQIRENLAADNPDDPAEISRLGNALGNGRIALVVTGATYGVAALAGFDEVADPAGRVLASLVAAGMANGLLKASVGRARPRLELGPGEFRPFALDNGWQSFPSGHATVAFALATAISAEADHPWVTVLTFSGAGLVAWSRSHEDRHWASDVVAGAAVGTVTAYHTSRRLHRRAEQRDRRLGARLLLGPDVLGVSFPMH
jgi:membrane-associated phospholipid phosphatase